MIKFAKICLHQNSIFENFENPRIFFLNPPTFWFCFTVRKCSQIIFIIIILSSLVARDLKKKGFIKSCVECWFFVFSFNQLKCFQCFGTFLHCFYRIWSTPQHKYVWCIFAQILFPNQNYVDCRYFRFYIEKKSIWYLLKELKVNRGFMRQMRKITESNSFQDLIVTLIIIINLIL